MKRERQWDMFDVAVGACPLDDYLFQRYSENDLQSKFWVEPSDQVDELRPPPKGSKEQVVIPIQGPAVTPPQPVVAEPLPSRPPWEAAPAAEPLPSRPPWEAAPAASQAAPPPPPAVAAPPSYAPPPPPTQPQAPQQAAPPWSPPIPAAPPTPAQAPAQASAPAQAPTPAGPSMADLLAQFHQAAKAYEERSKEELEADEALENETGS